MRPIVPPENVWSRAAAFWVGAVVGVATCICMFLATAMLLELGAGKLAGLLAVIIGVGIPGALICLCYRRIVGVTAVLIFGVGLSVGFAVIPTVLTVSFTGAVLSAEAAMQLVSLSAVGLLVGLGLWIVCRLIRGPVLVQDGMTCAKCKYSLQGNTTGVCPECGHAYTLEELGIG